MAGDLIIIDSVTGKYLGIWTSLKSPYELYHKYGFNELFIGDRQTALNAGFKADSLMGGINMSTSSVDQYGSIGYYHFDEPIEQGYSASNILWIASYIHDYYPNSKLMVSSYKSPGDPYYSSNYLNILFNASNTRIMCDQYYDGTIWYGHDQRQFWIDFKNFYSIIKNTANWISLDIDHDGGDYPALFAEADNLGINNLWVYGGWFR